MAHRSGLNWLFFSDPNWLCAPGANNGLEERRVLKSLDDYLIQSGMVKKKLDGIIVDAWINSLNVGGNTKAHYVSVYRQFAHYLTGLGYKAYIPPPLQIKRNYTPYVFTSAEMKRLFEACDNIPARRSLTKAEVWLPVMVRMLYGCGLRVGEAVSLQNKDIDWTEGTLLIRAAKGNKDRLVPMSNSLIDVCRTYHSIAHPFPNSEDFFFYNHKKQPLSTLTPYIWLRRALEIAGIDRHPHPKQLRGVCVHCLRHTFAVHTLQLQSKRGMRIVTRKYVPHAGYIDYGFDGDTLLHSGKYIKYPKNSNCQRWMKQETSRKFRNCQDLPRKGNHYRRLFDYWWTLY